MVWLVAEGDGTAGNTVLTAQEVTAYSAAAAIPAASRTSTEQTIVTTVEAAFASIATSEWSTAQQDNQATILSFASDLQGQMTRVIRNYAPKGQERAFTEMLSVLTRHVIDLKREIVDLQNP